jgi:zinc protease
MLKNIDFKKVHFDNGLTLLYAHNPRLPVVSLNAFLLVGKDQNPLTRAGTASLTARLLDEGTESFTHRQISELLENIGGQLSTFSDREITGICFQLMASELSLGMRLLTEMLTRPVFPEPRFENERKRVLNHLEAMSEDPQLIGDQLLNGQIYAGTPLEYPLLGTPESLSEITAKDLRIFHEQKYGPRNTLLVVVGANEFKEVLELSERELFNWENPNQELTSRWQLKQQDKPHTCTRPMNKEQLCIYLGHLGTVRDNPDYYALQVLDVILGGGPGFASRIPRRLRDEMGLAYTTYSDISGSSGLYPGRFVAYVGTSPDKRNEVLDGLYRTISEFVESGPTEDEIRLAQSFLLGNFVFEFHSNLSLARFLLTTEIHSLGTDFPKEYSNQIRSITCEDVSRVARDYLDTVNYTTVYVGAV